MKKQANPWSAIRGNIASHLSPGFPWGEIAVRGGAVLGVGTALAAISGAKSHLEAARTWPSVRRELKAERNLTDDEESRAKDLHGLMRKYAPDLAKDKIVAKGFVGQALTLSDEGIWTLLSNLTKTQAEVADSQPSLAKPIGLAATVATASQALTGG